MSLLRDLINIILGREFCETCGRPMKWVTYGSGYSRYNGRPVDRQKWACPLDHWQYKANYREVER
jgi:hypothetical protein